jgi:hypothetical protein
MKFGLNNMRISLFVIKPPSDAFYIAVCTVMLAPSSYRIPNPVYERIHITSRFFNDTISPPHRCMPFYP